MRHPIHFLAAIAFALAVVQSASADDPARATSECVSPPGEPRPPTYPQEAVTAGIGGRVLLEIATDACGAPLAVAIAESSGHPQLDAAAVEAARTWRLRAEGEGGRVRVPVLFSPDRGAMARLARTRDADFDQRRAMRAATPTLTPAGRVPGFVADALPIGYATVAEARREVMPIGSLQPSFDETFETVLVIDEEGLSTWSFAKPRTDFWPTVVRQRAVGDGTRGFWVTSVLCESSDRVACEALRDWLGEFPEQKNAPPPPPAE